jgi:hypothetical protein
MPMRALHAPASLSASRAAQNSSIAITGIVAQADHYGKRGFTPNIDRIRSISA